MKIRPFSHRYQVKDAHRYSPHKAFFLNIAKNALYSTCTWFARKLTWSVRRQHIAGPNTAEPTAEPSHHAIQNLTTTRPITCSVATWQHRDRGIGLRVLSVGGVFHCASKAALLPRTNQPGRQFVRLQCRGVELTELHSISPYIFTQHFTNRRNGLQRHTNVKLPRWKCSLAARDTVYI